jgi:hypothetical protein
MTLVPRSTVSRLIAIALVLISVPAFAATRRRAVGQPGPPPPSAFITISGTVTDAATGAPITSVAITGGNKPVNTDASGRYSIQVAPGVEVTITAARFGYSSVSQTIKPQGPQTVDFKLSPKPHVTVILTPEAAAKQPNGIGTYQLDLETSQFAYLVTFIGYAGTDNANFCRPDGTNWQPLKTEFSRIVGPATSSTFSTCCTLGPVLSVNVEMKDGTKTQAYFVDSCYGNEVDFLGRDLKTLTFDYFRFTDIAEIDF